MRLSTLAVLAGVLVAFHAAPVFAQVAEAPKNCDEVNARLDKLYLSLQTARTRIEEAESTLVTFLKPSYEYAKEMKADALRDLEHYQRMTAADFRSAGMSQQEGIEKVEAIRETLRYYDQLIGGDMADPDPETVRIVIAAHPEFFKTGVATIGHNIDRHKAEYRMANQEIEGLREISLKLSCNTPDTPPNAVLLPGTITVCHTPACIMPTELRLVKETGHSGEYQGKDFEGNPATATAELKPDGTIDMHIVVESKGFGANYTGLKRTGNVIEGTYLPGPGFGPRDVFKATVK